ncbi:MAG: TrmJ/YjtD family RNA methyltransferase [Verrucomicrobia bacterium]|nr:TrmJ/YjtD family RNA methyltransferase [Verrucomicrobiota bacterium]
MKIDDVVIVLVRPKVPGNIGSAARGMKVMGLSELRLVQPEADHLADDTRWLAYGSEDVLERARLFDDIPSAICDCSIRIATTHRSGRRRQVTKTLREYAAEAAALADGTRLALVFGNEEHGLSNDELALCDIALTVPQAVDYPSLNLAQAVVAVCTALYGEIVASKENRTPRLATPTETNDLYERMESALRCLGYRDVPDRNLLSSALRTIKRLFARAALRSGEARSLHGVFRRVEILAEKKGLDDGDEDVPDTSV